MRIKQRFDKTVTWSEVWNQKQLVALAIRLFKLNAYTVFYSKDPYPMRSATCCQWLSKMLPQPAELHGELFQQSKTKKSTRDQSTSNWSNCTASELRRSWTPFARKCLTCWRMCSFPTQPTRKRECFTWRCAETTSDTSVSLIPATRKWLDL